ncbi:MAG: 50S ribosomal protein L1 [Gammaproteobacteria bacterium]
MTKLSKRQKSAKTQVEPGKSYPVSEAFNMIQAYPKPKFNETVDVAINLGIDPKNSEQNVRGASNLPNGTGKTVKVAVFAQGNNADAARAAGAEKVGFEDLAEAIKGGDMDFDVVIATPDSMRIVGQLGQILGPRGLMPNPKVGTVTNNVGEAVTNAKGGQVRYRNDKGGILHCTIGKRDFESKALIENLKALLADLKKIRPSSAKGVFLKKITVSSTMGPGVIIDQSSLEG